VKLVNLPHIASVYIYTLATLKSRWYWCITVHR